MAITHEILNSHKVVALKKEISKTNIKGYSKMKKGAIVDLMMTHKTRFSHIKKAAKISPKIAAKIAPSPKKTAKKLAPSPKKMAAKKVEEEDDKPDLGDDDEILIDDILDLPQLMGMIDSSTYKEAEDRVIEAVKKHKIKSVNQWKKKKIILTLVPDLNPKLLK